MGRAVFMAIVVGLPAGVLVGGEASPRAIEAVDPDQIHAAWTRSPSTSLNIIWRTRDAAAVSEIQFRRLGETAWQMASGRTRPSGAAGRLHEVDLEGLTPASVYEYRVRGSDGTFSRVARARTAPSPTAQADTIEAVFLADTGLADRADGLTEATPKVIAAVASLDPHFVLLGGDYAYANTDLRGGSLPSAIDAWFDQMAPIAERAVMMPTYGNHEIKLREDYLFWAERFATPEGFDNRRFYSFRVGCVHFVSILAWGDNQIKATNTEHGPIGPTALQWIDADMAAARAAGARWIVPFLHVPPFSDGANHPSNVDVRAQLGPIFERHGVKVVLSAHDQSYERTFPLRGVPDQLEITSRDRHRYSIRDGVTYLKVGPGGKLSNKNKGFSPWLSETAPDYTAFRDNTSHHFARLRATEGELAVEIFSLRPGETVPEVQDRFTYAVAARESQSDAPAGQPFRHVEQGGVLSIEAEHFATRADSTCARYAHIHSWKLHEASDGASGGRSLAVVPDERGEDQQGPHSPRDTSGAALAYPIRVSRAGTYHVFVRGMCKGGESNGVHLGLNGRLAGREPGASNLSGFRPKSQWNWETQRKEGHAIPAMLELTVGDHTLNVWSRDDGFMFDKVVLALSPEKPVGFGPSESPRHAVSNFP
jgi:hypothetical protein